MILNDTDTFDFNDLQIFAVDAGRNAGLAASCAGSSAGGTLFGGNVWRLIWKSSSGPHFFSSLCFR